MLHLLKYAIFLPEVLMSMQIKVWPRLFNWCIIIRKSSFSDRFSLASNKHLHFFCFSMQPNLKYSMQRLRMISLCFDAYGYRFYIGKICTVSNCLLLNSYTNRASNQYQYPFWLLFTRELKPSILQKNERHCKKSKIPLSWLKIMHPNI